MLTPPDDYYERLQVSKRASRAEIKAAFRRLARRYHPDLNPNNPAALNQFRAIREAYDVLIDGVQRQRYDRRHLSEDWQDSINVPKTPQDFYIRGVNQALSRSYRAALDDYTEAIQRQPDFLEAYLRRSQVRYVLSDDAGVLADCQQVLRLDRGNAQAHYYLGLARYRLGYTQSAIAAFTDAIALERDEPQFYYQRGIAHEDIQEIEAAIADFHTAVRYFEDQGDLIGLRRVQTHLSEMTPGKFRSGKFSRNHFKPDKFEPQGKPNPRIRPPRPGRFLQLFFALLTNPAAEMLPIYGRLSPRQAMEVGCLLALVANFCFTLSGYELSRGVVGAESLAASTILLNLWVTGGAVFLSLTAVLAFSRGWFRRRGLWTGDLFIAGATVLPLGVFSLLLPVALIISPWLGGLLMLFAAMLTLLTLYCGCTQLHHQTEQTATWVTPSLLFISLSLGYLIWAAMG
ncbi:MAG: DnaJ domain-containing protein [Cyanobacteria bacterium P01_A01_bin.114]